MKAFVTGSTGLLGSNLVRLLVEQGYEVKALARSAEKARRVLGDLPVEIVVGDMEDIGGFAGAMAGCDVMFHTAAYFREYYQPGDHWKILEDINIKGTVRILEEAEKLGVKKVIYTSSAGVIGGKPGGLPGDETDLRSINSRGNLYFRSKVLAEQAVLDFLKSHRLPVVMILPGWMFGPSDAAPTSSGQLVLDFLSGKLPGTFDGGGSVVDARDVAQAMINAVERGRSGERYIVAGEFADLTKIAKTLEKVSGVPAPKMRFPYPILFVYAWVMQTIARLRGTETLLTVEGVRTLHEQEQISSKKAMRELGATFRSLEDTLRDEVNWFRARQSEAVQPTTVRVVNQA